MDDHDERDPGTTRLDDPWRDETESRDTDSGDDQLPNVPEIPALRSRGTWESSHETPGASGRICTRPGRDGPGTASAGAGSREAVYLEVHRSPAFREVRRRYRRFVLPATVLFLGWYFAYVITSTTAPEFMARPVAGGLNIAFLAGLGQFATTFLLTWAYARHARLRRDRAAMELRWAVYEQNRHHGDTGQEQVR
ncbi:DUF485 domain-containing protein [Streptomyces meridianus]|uniref:DUF485 domain-containing protein n=1 Tax=Streptomyces meridianus TaxID=2938945 RepID=A0ABT0X8G9_9ACTN|nr:DUF485 domain-containing protein [Streptomyces meridianus]MCM2578833.1 DUF485 domain-containing protein [Streptomyces meridianus]